MACVTVWGTLDNSIENITVTFLWSILYFVVNANLVETNMVKHEDG